MSLANHIKSIMGINEMDNQLYVSVMLNLLRRYQVYSANCATITPYDYTPLIIHLLYLYRNYRNYTVRLVDIDYTKPKTYFNTVLMTFTLPLYIPI